MESFFDWCARTSAVPAAPWLILGKGPSSAKLGRFDVTGFRILSLNHAVRERAVDAAHVIDLDVVTDCAEAIRGNARVLVMPWHPHVGHRPAEEGLDAIAAGHPVLSALAEEGRLLWYDLSTSPDRHGPGPVVVTRTFSAPAAVNLLRAAGVRTIRTLGIDGGTSYGASFKDLAGTTLLANGQPTFDIQFREIAEAIASSGIDLAPLDVESPIRFYVACTESELLPVKVLEHSIRKHASMTVQVVPLGLAGREIPKPKDPRNLARTPFSFQRFLIPELAGRKGRAVYLDADMQVFRDVRGLWTHPMTTESGDPAEILAVIEPGESSRRPQFSVMVLDCERLPWSVDRIVADLDAGKYTYEQLMVEMAAGGRVARTLPPEWNSLERYEEDRTALLHYTDMNTQPWVFPEHGQGHLWVRDLFDAIDRGAVPRAMVEEHVARGWVRPSLLAQVDRRIEDEALLPSEARDLDRAFAAPYTHLPHQRSGPIGRVARRARAVLRGWYEGSVVHKARRALSRRR